MKCRTVITAAASVILAVSLVVCAFGQETKPVQLQLPAPKLDSSKSLAQALKDRKTTREYATENLTPQVLSNLLWAACGINRPDSGRRTAPSAKNWQEIDVYVSTTEGMYLYDPRGHALVQVVSGDVRSLTFTQPVFKDAPVNVVYVADISRMADDAQEDRRMILAAMDTGFMAENVYLYCASQGLYTGFRVTLDKEKLGQALKLKPSQRIMAAQSVGLPKGK